ncbi:MAG: 2-oxoacid:acceptor oxidoreductase family protein [Chloroflexota bacterium]|jgi:2-oxoglutarate ferredoxin oxidoreductase subunit gamma|nr:2-oxoacid:acceptor oxidoreductase family protein [Chloroflexota bacterium]MDP6757615.1 2-oxoacid:acceptor oxidoreductase family protein [Chloroflexota bacterium]
MQRGVRLAGFGGQGIILSGYVLGKAAAIYDGKEAVFSQSYGPEARGGACAAQVVISDGPVNYHLFEEADCLALLSQEAYELYGGAVKPDATVMVDSDLVTLNGKDDGFLTAPFTSVAEEMGNRIVANIVMLGFFTAATGLVGAEAMKESIRTSVRERFMELNLQAFDRGIEMYEEQGRK